MHVAIDSQFAEVISEALPWPMRLAYLLWPWPVAWLSLRLMVDYLYHYDIGVNSLANSGFLAWVVAPMLLVCLYACAWAAWVQARHPHNSYPSEQPQDLLAFLVHWLSISR